jgi:D-tyrosyl-tRNA(Tyr) deacylase
MASAAFTRFVERLRRGPVAIESGWFQAHMSVEIHNDGPITILLER